MGTIKSNGPHQRFFCMAWAKDLSAFGQHQKFLLHARKIWAKEKLFLCEQSGYPVLAQVAYQITEFTSSWALEKSSRVIINFLWT